MRSEVQVLLDPPPSTLGLTECAEAIACNRVRHPVGILPCLSPTGHSCPIIERICGCAGSSDRTRLSDIVERFTSVSPVTPSRGLPRGLRPRRRRYCQVKYTNQHAATNQCSMGVVCFRIRNSSDALSGSDQARKGRLVDALAARGDEGRDTLR